MLKFIAKLSFRNLLLALFAIILIYSRYIEPNWIEVTHHTIQAPIKKPIRIALLADLHTEGIGYRERALLQLLDEEYPDIILVAGDSITDSSSYAEVQDLLARFHAPLGTVLVRGNWEHWRPDPSELAAYAQAKVKFLNNQSLRISNDLWILGIDDEFAGQPELAKAQKDLPANVYKIGLFHSPAYFKDHASSFDLALAGHTHGGQVRLPFLGALVLPPHSAPYEIGWYKSGDSKLYVSRGIGNSLLELRFLCRPELTIINLVPN